MSHKTETIFIIAEGTEVEVSSDDEGFKGAWYRATIEETPGRSKRKKVLVKYATLVQEDGSTPLTELVDLAYIRPLPPENKDHDGIFEENDVVDAGYRDGWWIGVVRKVLENSRCRVYFDNPPDVIEFEGKDLRPHFDWVYGKWVRPGKQQSESSMFSLGTSVEVNLQEENLRDLWVSAIVIKENKDGTLFVKYISPRNDDEAEAVKVTVDSSLIRPTPPPFKERDYDLLECVDTVHDLGWREGIITKLLAGKRYTVFFKHANENKEFDQSVIRPHMEWEDGKWVKKSKESLVLPSPHKQLGYTNNGTDSSKTYVKAEKSPCATQNKTKERTPSTRIGKKWADRSTPCSESYALSSAKKIKLAVCIGGSTQSSLVKMSNGENTTESRVSVIADRSKKIPNEASTVQAKHGSAFLRAKSTRTEGLIRPTTSNQPSTERKRPLSTMAASRKWQITGESEDKTSDSVTNGSCPFKSPHASAARLKVDIAKGLQAKTRGKNSTEETPKLERDHQEALNDTAGDKKKEIKEQKSGGSSQKRKRGRPHKLMSPELPQAVDQSSDLKGTGVSDSDFKAKKTSKAAAEAPKSVAEDDQPLSTWIGGNILSGAEETRLSSIQTANGDSSHIVEKQIDIRVESPTKEETQILPFPRRSPIWKTIESMEVFRTVPQRPHFSPLLQTKEEYREGSAIGIMVTFSGLFEKIASFQFDDPRSIFDSITESLLDLEKHGFDVTVPQGRINKLLSIKERQRQISDESKHVERELMTHGDEKRKFDDEMEEIRRKMEELQKQYETIKSQKESKVDEIARLKSHAETLNEQIQNALSEFGEVVTAPWKLPSIM